MATQQKLHASPDAKIKADVMILSSHRSER
jgi:hypothetical protein